MIAPVWINFRADPVDGLTSSKVSAWFPVDSQTQEAPGPSRGKR